MPDNIEPLSETITTELLNKLLALRQTMLDCLRDHQDLLTVLAPIQAMGAINLLQYLSFRTHDVQHLQDVLHELGLSSMASSESHICTQVEQIMQRLGWSGDGASSAVCNSRTGQASLDAHTLRLFGPRQAEAVSHIMVTLDESSGGSVDVLRNALNLGMTSARINCVHDSPAEWTTWIANLRTASAQAAKPCRLYMDLPGPKMRMNLLSGYDKKGNIPIQAGDEIRLVEDTTAIRFGEKAITCQERGIIPQLQADSHVLLDDGKYAGEIVRDETGCVLLITRVTGKKPRLQNDKGLNFPHQNLHIPILTVTDRQLLPFIAEHADMMGCSFVRSAGDIACLREALAAFPRRPDLILKIETPEAVLQLPELLLTAMQDSQCGVMIARGDLAVEMGFEQLSDVQDKILWICEAAHVPVIWATQVLESLNKTGLATRSEITDAAHGFKAECVMLNKGKFLLETLATLQSILSLTGGHRKKKRYNLRPLTVAREFFRRHPAR
jgi:pyruvate kinase